MTEICDVAIIGAGPYGLSLAAHLAHTGVRHRIFGKPMEAWATQMPKGMLLKSDGWATSLYDPARSFTFERYCRDRNIAYADLGVPPRLEDFVEYGREFQRRFAPRLEETQVVGIERDGELFRLRLDTGAVCTSRAVVVAAGISHFAHFPAALSNLPRDLVTHTVDHHDLSVFKGRKVAVLGGGASAVDVAGLLHEAGAEAHLIVRDSSLSFHTRMRLPRPLSDRLRAPSTKIGPGWRSFLLAKLPHVFRYLPEARRLRIVRGHLGPAPGYFMRDRVLGKVAVHYDLECRQAEPNAGGVRLTLASRAGETRELQFDHVICGTGYRPELARLPFLSHTLISQLRIVDGAPILSAHFESSVPGLYFVGGIAANTFGPILRFACGAEFAAPRLARHLNRRYKRPAGAGASESVVSGIAQPTEALNNRS